MLEKIFRFKLKSGIKFLVLNKFDEAISHFSKMIADNPSDIEAHYNLAKSYFKKGDLENCKKCLFKIVELNPEEKIIHEILEITNWKCLSSHINYYNASPSFSKDGKRIVFISVRRDTNNDGRINNLDNGGIYITDVDGKEEKCIISDEYYNSDPELSPDGRSILFLSRRRDTDGNGIIDAKDYAGIYLVDIETKREELLIPDDFLNKHASFSPAGKSVIFCSYRGGGKYNAIFQIDLKTKQIKEVVPGRYENTSPSYSPDGNSIIFSSWRFDTNKDGKIDIRDNSGIYLRVLSGLYDTVIIDETFNNSFPVFSPDGKKIAYLSIRRDTNNDSKIDSNDNAGIYIIDIETKKETLVANDNFYNKFPTFTKDGDGLIYTGNWRRKYRLEDQQVRDKFENKGIYYIDIKTGKIKQITSDKYYGATGPVVSPEGKVAYIGWRKGTRRGLFVADIYKVPTLLELKEIINNNL